MAADLIIGSNTMRVMRDTWEEQESTFQGARMTMALGNIVSTEDPSTETRVATCQVWFVSLDEELQFRASAIRGAPVAVTGGLPDRTFPALVDITQVSRQLKTIPIYGTILVRVATLRIAESQPPV